MLAEDPEAPTTIRKRFNYPAAHRRQGHRLGRRSTRARSWPSTRSRREGSVRGGERRGRAAAQQASNFQVVAPQRSATGNSLAVMGPQLGYYYPEIVQQIDLHGPGINAQGVAVPGLAMYILIGRTKNYAWSLTSANHDVRDVYAEKLCNPNGSAPTRASTHYRVQGQVPGAEGLRRRPAGGQAARATRPRCTAP